MNVANLQIEGLLMALASLNRLLVEKGIASHAEIDAMLRRAEAGLTGDDRFSADMPQAGRDAMCFPVRLLRRANEPGPDGFSELTRRVGQTKQPFNDQQ